MSYNFSVRGKDKLEARDAAIAEFDKIVEHQPVHHQEREVVQTALIAFLHELQGDPSRDVLVNCSGSVHYTGNGTQQLAANIQVGLAARE